MCVDDPHGASQWSPAGYPGGPMTSDVDDLLAVVRTVVDSLHDHSSTSVHDLLDAYATFAHRVRSHTHLLDACDTLPPALAPLKTHGDTFVRALRRDVRLAHIDPLSHEHSIKADAKQHARDSSALCHHALCAITTIFRFPAFHFVFPGMSSLIRA